MNHHLRLNQQEVQLDDLVRHGKEVRFSLEGVAYHFRLHSLPDGTVLLERELAPGLFARKPVHVETRGTQQSIRWDDAQAMLQETGSTSADATSHTPGAVAPMPALLRSIKVKQGEHVAAGAALAVLEAMKLQLTLCAQKAGIVEEILAAEGDRVNEDTLIIRLTYTEEAGA